MTKQKFNISTLALVTIPVAIVCGFLSSGGLGHVLTLPSSCVAWLGGHFSLSFKLGIVIGMPAIVLGLGFSSFVELFAPKQTAPKK